MCPDGLGTVGDCLRVPCRCPGGLGDSLAPFGSLLQVSKMILIPSQTVCESSAGAPTVWETVWHRQGVCRRFPDGLGTVTDCLGVSCR
ncbi:hypothetical protein DPMN_109300 [Dreissena polymorpha]|uniref:Uncharacterized protein n=1 Tax=Dreissena polymorpha TaxID=45954 RepID=A0A9D4KAV9_DREPO|nr:hypothetical protein DPMN_109300 [Dreissena polymorpha]